MAANREHATKGFKVVVNTTATNANFYGMTILSDTVISSISAPTTSAPDQVTAYNNDNATLAGQTLNAGLYLPIRGSAITLTSGRVILWLE